MGSIFAQSLYDRRRVLLGWAIGIAALVAFTFAFWPSIEGNAEFRRAFDELPEAFQMFVGDESIVSPIGYLESQLFLYFVPVLLFIYGLGRGADAIAGEEQRKTMDLLLANPVSRRDVVLGKFASVLAGLAIMTATLLVTSVLGVWAVDMDIGMEGLTAVCVGTFLLGAAFGALTLALSAWTGRKGLSIGVSATIATASYLIYSLAPQVDVLDAIDAFSPFYYYLQSSPLRNGFAFADLSVLVVLTAAFLVAAVIGFDRRDVFSGG